MNGHILSSNIFAHWRYNDMTISKLPVGKNAMSVAFAMMLTMLLSPAAYAAQHNFFIEITDQHIIVGEYVGKHFKEKILLEFEKESIDIPSITAILLPDHPSRNLYYIHSMWGGVQPYHRNSLKLMNTMPSVDRMISVVWHTSGTPYTGSWHRAIEPGQSVALLMQALWSEQQQTNFLLCHSMGHRVLEGIVSAVDPQQVQLEDVILAASDLHMDSFSNRLQPLASMSKRVHAYVNDRDHALKFSKLCHQQDRIGAAAAARADEFEFVTNLQIIDLSDSKTNGKASRRSHIYFKRHTGVLRDIGLILAGKNKERQQYLLQAKDNCVIML